MRNLSTQLQKIRQTTQPGQSDFNNRLKLLNYDPMDNREGGKTYQT